MFCVLPQEFLYALVLLAAQGGGGAAAVLLLLLFALLADEDDAAQVSGVQQELQGLLHDLINEHTHKRVRLLYAHLHEVKMRTLFPAFFDSLLYHSENLIASPPPSLPGGSLKSRQARKTPAVSPERTFFGSLQIGQRCSRRYGSLNN